MSDTYNLDSRPPCWEPGTQCPNSCASDYYRRVIDNHVALTGPWAGWRLAGRDLVAPSGERIPERRLRCLLWHVNAADLRDAPRKTNAARKRVSSRWSRSLSWILASGGNATSEPAQGHNVLVGAGPYALI